MSVDNNQEAALRAVGTEPIEAIRQYPVCTQRTNNFQTKNAIRTRMAFLYQSQIYNYQTLTRSFSGRYILSPGFTLNALYQASVFDTGPFTLYISGECGSVLMRIRMVSSRVFMRQTWPKERKKRWSGVNPSILVSPLPCCSVFECLVGDR